MTNAAAFSAGTAWPSANRAIFIPFGVARLFTAQKMSAYTGATGNIDVGIYDEAGTRLVSLGSTAAASGTPSWDITDTVLSRGIYYMAMASDNTGFTIRATATNNNTATIEAFGMAQMASAFPLPSTATFAKVTSNFIPLIAISGRSLFT